ncbi:hypothetical protein [Anaerorhabdus sp.]|uniref:hypothetical protein n=1 Tax=Anaerorhabdus sp. TaxID=1872524 RepID=UPI002FCBC172
MLKLIKYEMIHSYRNFALVFGIFLLACLIVPFLPYDISAIGASIIIFAFFGISIAVFVTIIKNYNTSMFKKPGYLTLTLPVSSHELVLSKVISAFLWLTITSIVLAVGIMILVFAIITVEGVPINMNEFFNAINYAFGRIDLGVFLIGLVQGILEGLVIILGLFVLVTAVQTKYTRNHKTAISFLIFIAYTVIMSFIGMNLPISMQESGFIFEVMEYGKISSISINWYLMIMTIVEIVAFYGITVYILEKKIEIE